MCDVAISTLAVVYATGIYHMLFWKTQADHNEAE